MELIADILLLAAAVGAGLYCIVLSRRLRKFSDLEKGVGGAIALMSTQVDDMSKTLRGAQASATDSTARLDKLTMRAEEAANRLELLVASMHDLPDMSNVVEKTRNTPRKEQPDLAPAADIETALAENADEAVFLSRRRG